MPKLSPIPILPHVIAYLTLKGLIGQKEILNQVIRTHGRDFADELLLLSITEAFLGTTNYEICRPAHGFAPEDSPVQFRNQN